MKNIAWIDVHHRKYTLSQLDDGHLMNIIKFIYRGGGYDQFLTREKVANLYVEARKRGFKFHFSLKELQMARFE